MRKMRQVVGVIVLMMAVMLPYKNSDAVASVCSINTAAATIELHFTSSSSSSVGTAVCAASIIGKTGTDKINGTMKLYKVTSRAEVFIKSWDVSATGRYLDVVKTCSVSKGKYKLTYTMKVYKDGVAETIKREFTRTYS